MTQRTILVLGANAGQADLIRNMVDRGWYTVACAHLSGLPGEFLAHRFEKVDIRDIDAVVALAREINADLIYSISSDLAIKTAVKASERLGLPHFFDSSLIELFDKKNLLRAHLNAHGLSEVAYREIGEGEEITGWTEFPCVVKPADAQGQRGVVIAHDAGQLAGAVGAAISLSPTRKAIIESYLPGVEVSSNVLVQGKQVIINEVSERLVHRGALYGIPKGHLVPCYNVTPEMIETVRALVRDVVASLGIEAGCLYFQMKITPDGPKIIEIAPRLDGCHMWRLIYYARGIDFLQATINVLLNETPGAINSGEPPAEESVSELIFQQTRPGEIFSSTDFPVPEGALYHEYRYRDGETVLPINGQMEVVGYYVRHVPSAEAAKFRAEMQ